VALTSCVLAAGPGPSGGPASPALGPQHVTQTGSTPSPAINADRAVCHASATAGRDVFTGLDVAIIVAAALIAVGCAWGLAPRLAEHR
jgi:hypothetical protein